MAAAENVFEFLRQQLESGFAVNNHMEWEDEPPSAESRVGLSSPRIGHCGYNAAKIAKNCSEHPNLVAQVIMAPIRGPSSINVHWAVLVCHQVEDKRWILDPSGGLAPLPFQVPLIPDTEEFQKMGKRKKLSIKLLQNEIVAVNQRHYYFLNNLPGFATYSTKTTHHLRQLQKRDKVLKSFQFQPSTSSISCRVKEWNAAEEEARPSLIENWVDWTQLQFAAWRADFDKALKEEDGPLDIQQEFDEMFETIS